MRLALVTLLLLTISTHTVLAQNNQSADEPAIRENVKTVGNRLEHQERRALRKAVRGRRGLRGYKRHVH